MRCLDVVRHTEIDTEETGQLVRLLGSYKNLGAGDTEIVLSNIFIILAKLAKYKPDFREKFGELTISECTDILTRNQERNLLNNKSENK